MKEMKNGKGIDINDAILDKAKVWGDISRRCRAADRRRRGARFIKYAALIAVPLLSAGALLWYADRRQDVYGEALAAARLEPGRTQAVIWTEDHEYIDITNIKRDTVIGRQGYNIRLDQSGTIFYEPVAGYADGRERCVWSTIFVPRAGEHKLVLPDGTRVWLNSDTELRFPVSFTDDERRVELRGEAYFDVAHDPSKPFRVAAEEITITALGTMFNVKNYKNEPVQATLAQGSVRVESHVGTETLCPGQQFVLNDGAVEVRQADLHASTAWMDGKFYFDSTPLSEIAGQMERWYDISIVFAVERLRNERFTGVIDRRNSANDVMQTLEKIIGLSYDIRERTIVIH